MLEGVSGSVVVVVVVEVLLNCVSVVMTIEVDPLKRNKFIAYPLDPINPFSG